MRILQLKAAHAVAAFCAALGFMSHVAPAMAQHADVAIGLNGNELVIQNDRFSSALRAFLVGPGFPPMPSAPPTQTDSPGFSAADGTLPAGTKLSLRVVQSLHYWNPTTLKVENPTPLDTVFRLETFGGAGIDVTRAGIPDAPPLEFATASAEGGVHQHVLFKLPEATAPNGAYGLVMRLTAPGFVDSAPFLLTFGQQISASHLNLAQGRFINSSCIAAPQDALGDVTRDFQINGADVAAWKAGFGKSSYALVGDGDADRDGDVDGSDFLQIQRDVGKFIPAVPASSPVPEPATPALAASAALGAIAVARRRRGILREDKSRRRNSFAPSRS
jgi:hypothetical protein